MTHAARKFRETLYTIIEMTLISFSNVITSPTDISYPFAICHVSDTVIRAMSNTEALSGHAMASSDMTMACFPDMD